MSREDDNTTKILLRSIKEDLKDLDDKWEAALSNSISQGHVLKQLTRTVEQINTVVVGVPGGQPSIVSKVNNLEDNLAQTKTAVANLHVKVEDNSKKFEDYKSLQESKVTPLPIMEQRYKLAIAIIPLIIGLIAAYFGLR